MHYNEQDILNLDRMPRVNLISAITGVKPANLVGTISSDGIHNLAIFSSVVHMGSRDSGILRWRHGRGHGRDGGKVLATMAAFVALNGRLGVNQLHSV